jgi:putative sterol carrier protein
MGTVFPSAEWLKALEEKLNSDERYAQVARNWEGDLLFIIQPQGKLTEEVRMYLDLWHGKCRRTEMMPPAERQAAFVLTAPYEHFVSILQGRLDPMTAMMTSKLKVRGSMAYMMRNVPTVLDFVRCCREITQEIL